MNLITDLIVPSFRINRMESQKLLAGVEKEKFAQKPRADGQVLEMNHPAFIYGHLSIYPSIVLTMAGGSFAQVGEALRPSENYTKIFSKGAQCVDDQNGDIYPAKDEILSYFVSSYDRLEASLGEMSKESLLEETSGERRSRFPTKGSFLIHIITSHMSIHLGQMSAWRRAMRLPPAI